MFSELAEPEGHFRGVLFYHYLILSFSGFIYSFIPSFNLCFLYFDVAFKDERKGCSWILDPAIAFALHNFGVIILKENKCNGNVNVKGRTS